MTHPIRPATKAASCWRIYLLQTKAHLADVLGMSTDFPSFVVDRLQAGTVLEMAALSILIDAGVSVDDVCKRIDAISKSMPPRYRSEGVQEQLSLIKEAVREKGQPMTNDDKKPAEQTERKSVPYGGGDFGAGNFNKTPEPLREQANGQ